MPNIAQVQGVCSNNQQRVVVSNASEAPGGIVVNVNELLSGSGNNTVIQQCPPELTSVCQTLIENFSDQPNVSQGAISFIQMHTECLAIDNNLRLYANADVPTADRAQAVMEACKQHLSNVSAVARRSGLITLFAVALRELAAEGLRQATLEPSSGRALAIISSLVGPALNLAGWLRAERHDNANWHNRAGRFALGITSLSLAAWLVQADLHESMMPVLTGTVLYCGLRDSLNLLWQLPDNVDALHLGCSTAAGLGYGILGGALDYLGGFMEQTLNISDPLAALFTRVSSMASRTALHAVSDDTLLPYLNALCGTQDGGTLAIVSTYEPCPDTQALLDKLTGPAALRMCALNVINMVLALALHAQILGDEQTSARLQPLLVGLAYFMIYVPFVAGALPQPFGQSKVSVPNVEVLGMRPISEPGQGSRQSAKLAGETASQV